MRSRCLAIAVALSSLALLACPSGADTREATQRQPSLPRAQISIGIQRVDAEVAETRAQKTQGLSDRTTLPEGTGMWFPYPDARRRSFWMRDMHFPLDFVWVRDGTIVALNENVSPAAGEGTKVQPKEPIDAVLEVPGGTIARWGWTVGMPVQVLPRTPAEPEN
jgi:hypothetical protein